MDSPREKVIVFMPAYHAAHTLPSTLAKIPRGYVDDVVVVDDHSQDGIDATARALGVRFFQNERNLGYGGNLKVCIRRSLELGADILIELHPDDQYDPSAIPAALDKLQEGYDIIFGTRFSTRGAARRHGMPAWKYAINRLSQLPAQLTLGTGLTEFHCGFRVYRKRVFEQVAYQRNDDDYAFSFEIIAQARYAGLKMGEVPVVCRYFPGATQISFRRSITYGAASLRTLGAYTRSKLGFVHPLFAPVTAPASSSR